LAINVKNLVRETERIEIFLRRHLAYISCYGDYPDVQTNRGKNNDSIFSR